MPADDGRLNAGTNVLSVTAEKVATGQPFAKEVLLQNDPANTVNILVGDEDNQVIVLVPGRDITLPVPLDGIWVVAASGTPTLNWLATNYAPR